MAQMENSVTRNFPEANRHGELKELFPDVFFVTGSMRMPGRLPFAFSRNMTVLRNDGTLTLINSVRLGEEGLAALDALGKVEHVIRLAGFHGMDDPFYKDRYQARVWAVKGQVYAPGFDATLTPEAGHFRADVDIDEQTDLPIPNATLYRFKSARPGEGLILLHRDGGILISGDCLQNWGRTDRYFSWLARPMMKWKGFIKPYTVGSGWLRLAKPDDQELRGLLELEFDHVLPAHGADVIGNAKARFRPAIENLVN